MAQETAAANQQAAREWQSNPALHNEFTSFDAYAAYCRAVTSGRVRVSEKKTPTVSQNAHTHSHVKPLPITQADPGHQAQHDPENQKAAREWQANPALNNEFTSFDAYAAYCRALTDGRARGSEQKGAYLAPNTYMHDKPIAPPDPLHSPRGGSFPAPDAADECVMRWRHPISIEVLNIAREVRATNRHRGRSAVEELIAAKAGVSMDVASTARSIAVQDYPKRAAHG